jgi:acetylornithine deacetylase/succinyl-diaminopimelate desuccinylase-like protein
MSTRSESRPASPKTARLKRIRDVAELCVHSTLDRTVEIAQVAAPTNDEQERSRFVASYLKQMGRLNVTVDEIGDVVTRVAGKDRTRAVLLAAHIDTVFPRATAIEIVRSNGRISGPGIGDNSLGVASVMSIPEILEELGETPAVDLLITGNVGEEGLGNLRGMRAVMDAHPEIAAVIAVEGHNLGRVTHVAVGSRRLRITITGPGGHSWGDFGNSSTIAGAADIIHELTKIPLPSSPKTTLNVGTIRGGISINTIARETIFDVDLRSIEDFALRRLTERSERIIRAPRIGLTVSVEVIGERPAGFVSPESQIVRRAVQILDTLGVQPAGDASSTDANIPISRGIPAICVGLTTGGNVHREDEYIDTEPVALGLTQLIELALIVAEDVVAGTAGA